MNIKSKLSKIKLFNSEFVRSTITLMTGTAIAQAIPIAISPILTRIYTPEDFGILAIFGSILAILSVVSSLRYELAIVQPQKNEDASSIVFLSSLIVFIISIIILIVIYFYNDQIQIILGNKKIGNWLYLLPLSVLITGLYQSLNYWHIRNKLYKNIAYSNINKSLTSTTVQVTSGVFSLGSIGLIWGLVLGQFIKLISLFRSLLKREKKFFINFDFDRIKKNAKVYKRIPQFSSIGALTNQISNQLPILFISRFYDLMTTGIFSLTIRVLSLPLSLVSKALSEVLLQKVSQMHHISPDKIKKIILKLFLILISTLCPFVFLIWYFGEDLFAFAFGEPWREAGKMASILIFAVALRFAVSSLSTVLLLNHNIKLGVIWQVIYFITISVTFSYSYFKSFSIYAFIYAYVFHDIMLYLIYFLFVLKGSSYKK